MVCRGRKYTKPHIFIGQKWIPLISFNLKISLQGMLPKQYRLRKTQDFEKVFAKSGKPFFAPTIFVKIGANKQECSRFGFVVGTKVSKKAVERNRIKRCLRSFVQENLENIAPGFDIIVVARPSSNKTSYEKLACTLRLLLTKARILT